MKITVWFAAAGAVLGAAVAVIAHFLSHTPPRMVEFVGIKYGSGGGTETLLTPPVHPSWWPVLPLAIAIGLVVGGIIGLVLQRSGFALVRQGRPGSADPA